MGRISYATLTPPSISEEPGSRQKKKSMKTQPKGHTLKDGEHGRREVYRDRKEFKAYRSQLDAGVSQEKEWEKWVRVAGSSSPMLLALLGTK